jgi:hypothetical protein
MPLWRDDVDRVDTGAAPGESLGDGAADSTGAAGDETDFAGETGWGFEFHGMSFFERLEMM